MAISINTAEIQRIIAHEISEVTDYHWCCESACVIGQMQDNYGNTVQIQIVVTQEDEHIIHVEDDHKFPITVEE